MTERAEVYAPLRRGPVGTGGERLWPVATDHILDSLPFGICLISRIAKKSFRTVRTNAHFKTLLGPSDPCGLDPKDETFTPLSMDPAFLHAEEALSYGVQDEIRFTWKTDRGGSHKLYSCILQNFSYPSSNACLLLTIHDSTSELALQQQALRDALHDRLTQLPNQAMLLLRLGEWLTRRRPRQIPALIIINLNRFQAVNESLGYQNGDTLLCGVAARLKECLPADAVVARNGGDEFAAFLPNCEADDAQSVARHIHHQLTAPVTLDGYELHISASIGIACGSSRQIIPEDLLRDASIAMHRAKREGLGRTVVYHEDIRTRAKWRFKFEGDLRHALERNELFLHYQPIFSLTSGELVGFEALCRWQHPERGFVPPTEFISVAESCGLIIPLGRWALNTACAQLVEWSKRFPAAANLHVNVNVSGIQIGSDNMAEAVRQALHASQLDGHRLRLEITESALMTNAELAADLLLDLKSYGVGLALDDFGTGYSSLSYLSRFPIDTIKIDRSFINNLENNPDDYKIVHIITLLASTLGITAVAEGIETNDQLVRLKMLGCHYGQGYHFSRPLSVVDVETLLLNTPRTSSSVAAE